MKKHTEIFLFAGESSADLHGEKLIKALLSKNPELDIWGVGGPKMRAAGLRCILPMEEFQVMGFIDVFIALPRLLRHFYFLRKIILETTPNAAVFIDYPGFNLRMEKHLRKKGFSGFICHYICPSVWAWGKKRIPEMAKTLDRLLTILPFESSYFSNTALPVHYVGHPLIKQIPFRQKECACVNIIALFPGSRKKEIERNFPQYLRCIKKLKEENPNLECIISLAHPRFATLLIEQMQKENVAFQLEENSYTLMEKADLALAKSGTITLELALHNVPTVVTYGITKFDLFIAKYLFKIHLPFYCLVNIIYGAEVFPELIGPYFKERTLFIKTSALLKNQSLRKECLEKCKKVRELLGNQDASVEAADMILSELKL